MGVRMCTGINEYAIHSVRWYSPHRNTVGEVVLKSLVLGASGWLQSHEKSWAQLIARTYIEVCCSDRVGGGTTRSTWEHMCKHIHEADGCLADLARGVSIRCRVMSVLFYLLCSLYTPFSLLFSRVFPLSFFFFFSLSLSPLFCLLTCHFSLPFSLFVSVFSGVLSLFRLVLSCLVLSCLLVSRCSLLVSRFSFLVPRSSFLLSSFPPFLLSARLSHAQHGTCTHRERQESKQRSVAVFSRTSATSQPPPWCANCVGAR